MGRARRAGASAALLATLLLAGCAASGDPDLATSAVSSGSSAASTASGSTPAPTMVSTVTVDPRLPSAQQLPAGLLATTDVGWMIATVVGRAADENASSDPARVVDLISPDGVRYELPDLGAFVPDQWLPGSPLALGVDESQPPGALAVIDLETGETVLRPDVRALVAGLSAESLEATFVGDGTTDLVVTVRSSSAGRTVRMTLDGEVVAQVDRGLVRLMPNPSGADLLAADVVSGAPVLLDLSSLAELTLPSGAATCFPEAWLGGGGWLAACGGQAPTWSVVEPTTTWQLPLGPGSDVRGLTTDADGAAVVALRTPGGPDDVVRATVTDVTSEDTGEAFVWGAFGPAVVGSATLPPGGTADPVFSMPAPVTAWDVTDGSSTVLVPTPLKGVASVFPLRAPGTPVTGGWFAVDGEGGVWFQPAD